MEITDIKVTSKKSSRKFFKSVWIGVNKKEREHLAILILKGY